MAIAQALLCSAAETPKICLGRALQNLFPEFVPACSKASSGDVSLCLRPELQNRR